MKKSQLFPLVGFLLGWGAPLGALVLEYVGQRAPQAPLDFLGQEWAKSPFLYWYMLLGTSLVLSLVGYLLGKSQDREDLRNLQRLQDAVQDALTGLITQSRLHELLAVQFKRHLDTEQPISGVMLDLDCFRKINEAYGRPFGDTVLKDFAQLLRHALRQGDTAARYGGEEFFCVLPDCDEKDAKAVAERIRTETEKLVFPMGKTPVKITVSVGAVTVHDSGRTDYRFLIEESEKNLNRAKEQGGNKTIESVFFDRAMVGR